LKTPSAPSRRPDPNLICKPGEKEALELQNQASAFAFVSHFFEHDAARNPFTRGTLLQLHELTIEEIFPCAGQFRDATSQIRIAGASFTPAPAYQIEAEITAILEDAMAVRKIRGSDETATKVDILARLFHRFIVLHPFNGGNGRVGRLLLHLAFYDFGLLSPPDEIFGYIARRRDAYLRALKRADSADLVPLRYFFWRGLLDVDMQQLLDDVRKHAKSVDYPLQLSPSLRRFLQPSNRNRLSDNTFLDRTTEVFRVVDGFHAWWQGKIDGHTQ
jgi:Fic family protein